jgi:DNA-nicking Smr family endonuclease
VDRPAPPRGRRALTEEERALWDSVAGQIKPLRNMPRDKAVENVSPRAEAGVAGKSSASKKVQISTPAAPRAARPAPPPLVPLGRRERSQLSRGQKDIEARLDLHGMTQARAHHALAGFLQRAHLDGLTFVLVITGKGSFGADSGRGVLRRQVPHWLAQPEFRSLVVGFEEAHIGHGGEGALYVRIRRAAR